MNLNQKIRLKKLLVKHFDLDGLHFIANTLHINLGRQPDDMDKISTEIINRCDFPNLKNLLLDQTNVTSTELLEAVGEELYNSASPAQQTTTEITIEPQTPRKIPWFTTLIGIATIAGATFAGLSYFEMINISIRDLTPAKPCTEEQRLSSDHIANQALQQYKTTGKISQEQLDWLQQAIATCPQNAHAHNNYASTLSKQTPIDYATIEKHYRIATELDPSIDAAWYGLGETYYRQGQHEQSLKAFLNICADDPRAKKRVEELVDYLRDPTLQVSCE